MSTVMNDFSLRVANLGYAIVAVGDLKDRMFGLLPEIETVQPFEGNDFTVFCDTRYAF